MISESISVSRFLSLFFSFRALAHPDVYGHAGAAGARRACEEGVWVGGGGARVSRPRVRACETFAPCCA